MSGEERDEMEEVEEVDGVIVVAEAHELPLRQRRSARVAVAANTAIVAGGFVAGAATAVVVAHRRARRSAAQSAPRRVRNTASNLLDVEATRSFLVDVHVLSKRP